MKKSYPIVLALVVLGASLVFAQPMGGDIRTEQISYSVDGQNFVGHLAYDASSTARRPGVIVVHEWRGINDYARKRAVDLAREGYVAFALDMYGDGKEIPASEARAMSTLCAGSSGATSVGSTGPPLHDGRGLCVTRRFRARLSRSLPWGSIACCARPGSAMFWSAGVTRSPGCAR